MAKLKLEGSWREELKPVAAAQSRDPGRAGPAGEPNGQTSLRWGGDEAESRRLLYQQTHHYFRWAFVAVVAAVIVAFIAFGLTFLH
jgi:hypothetical protein